MNAYSKKRETGAWLVGSMGGRRRAGSRGWQGFWLYSRGGKLLQPLSRGKPALLKYFPRKYPSTPTIAAKIMERPIYNPSLLFFGSFICSPPGGRISFLKPFLTDLVFCFLSLHVCVHVCVCVRMYLAMLFFILHFISHITICIIHVLVIY